MNRSFAQNPRTPHAITGSMIRWLLCVTYAFTLGACATLPPPTSELAAAQQAVMRADDADADQYAADAIALARNELAQAQAAMAKGRDNDARALAVAASGDADFAYATSDAAKAHGEYAQQRQEVIALQQRLQVQAGEIPEQSPLDIAPPSALPVTPGPGLPASDAAARLQALETDPRLSGFAAYERLRARQAVDALAATRGREQAAAARIADRRVAIAELAARTQATRREVDRLQRTRSELLVEASRQDAERARQEAERLRVEAQIQAEEAQRLREQADAATVARQQAEEVILDVGASEAAKLKAARDREAALARQEAALIAAGKAASGAATKPSSKKAKSRDSSSSRKKKN
jgi:hypothetical protein